MSDDKTTKRYVPSKLRRKRKIRIRWIRLIAVLLAISCLAAVGMVSYIAADLPAFDPQQLSGATSTLLYDEKGQQFTSLHAGENRTEVSLDKIPPVLLQAFIATEDKEFYSHHGFTFRGIARAMLRNVQSGDLTGQGASTITQQLARSAFLTADKNWLRKIKEVFLAVKIETKYSKDEILEMYVNKIYFGAGAYGVQAAANTYFAKDVSQLTLPESALLAGLVQSPNNYNPFTNLDKAKARQKLVLNSMVTSAYIEAAAADQAYAAPLNLAKGRTTTTQYGFYIDAVIEEAIPLLAGIKGYEDADSALYESGLKIYTTLNAPLQAYAEEYFKNPANFPASNIKGQTIQTGMAIVENSSGAIKAVMGGREYEQMRGFNRGTDAYRQPGSAIKPLTVYSPALEEGKMPFLVLNDAPISYKTASGVWEPKNYDETYRGLITMRTAVQYSVNTYAVQLEDLVGIRHGFDMGKSLGLSLVDSPGKNDLNLASLALGGLTKGATPVQMAAAYSAFGNTGLYNNPHFITKIVDSNGVVVYEFKPNSKRVMTEQTSWLMNNLLQTVVSSGTGTNAKVPNVPTAGKTGTSEELTDAWFCGVTPLYSGAIWMGYDDQKYKMVNSFGGGAPALMFRAMMTKIYQGAKAGDWSMPADIVQVNICSQSGKLAAPACPQDLVKLEFSLKGYVPTLICDLPHQGTPVVSQPSAGPSYTAKVCTDPRHGGSLYLANIASSSQTGGCPAKYVKDMVLQSGVTIPACALKDHQIKR